MQFIHICPFACHFARYANNSITDQLVAPRQNDVSPTLHLQSAVIEVQAPHGRTVLILSTQSVLEDDYQVGKQRTNQAWLVFRLLLRVLTRYFVQNKTNQKAFTMTTSLSVAASPIINQVETGKSFGSSISVDNSPSNR